MSFYVTTPIYYVNDRPHLGHAYTTVLADFLARSHRLQGEDTWFLTGTDEHGQKVQDAAARNGVDPEAHCDRMVVHFQDLWKELGVAHDDFIRTTEERHVRVVQAVLSDLRERDEIYLGTYTGWYCVSDERFWTEKDLQDGNCPDCGRPATQIEEQNYFFRMGRHRDWLAGYIQEHPDFIRPETRRNEVLGFLRQDLGDLCISRPAERITWGIPLPFDERYVTYVWFDALLNYVSAIGYGSDGESFQDRWSSAFHLIGKDIVTTHCVYWPIMLRAMGLEPPRHILAHGWWLVGGAKMSKSRGEVVDPLGLARRYGADAFRYFVLREMVVGNDAAFTQELFDARYRADLANDLGNLESRSLSMVQRYTGGVLPEPFAGEGDVLRDCWNAVRADLPGLLHEVKINRMLERIWDFVRAANRFVEDSRPWDLAKSEDSHRRLGGVLYSLCEALRLIAVALEPAIPGTSAEILRRLGYDPAADSAAGRTDWGRLKPEARVEKGPPLFPKDVP